MIDFKRELLQGLRVQDVLTHKDYTLIDVNTHLLLVIQDKEDELGHTLSQSDYRKIVEGYIKTKKRALKRAEQRGNQHEQHRLTTRLDLLQRYAIELKSGQDNG